MRAIRIHEYGGPEVMQLEELPDPVPGAGQALVRVQAASVNFLDVQKRRGELVGQKFYQKAGVAESEFPATMGSQGVGVIEAVGEGVDNVKPGDRVVFAGASYATHAVSPAKWLVPVPAEIPLEAAAAGMNQGFLAYVFTHFAYPVTPGDWCLVQAAAGGIGLLLCQMAKLRGGRVIGVTSTSEKAPFVREAGADEVIVTGNLAAGQNDVATEVRRLTNGRGVNVVFDGVGKDTFDANLDSLAMAGYLVIYGQSSGYVLPFDLMKLQEKGSLYLTRTNGLPWFKEYPSYTKLLASWLRKGQISILIHRTYPLAEAPAAHAELESRSAAGRMLLVP
jgi:NADPH2:quinone reductase